MTISSEKEKVIQAVKITKPTTMKTKLLYIFLFFAGIAIFSIHGCKKAAGPEPRTIIPVSNQSQKILRLIKNFKNDMHSSLKSGEEMTIDSAIWYLTATLNESFARIDSTKKNMFEDSSFIAVPLTPQGTVSMENIDLAYNEMVQDLRDYYHTIEGYKCVLFVDLIVTSVQTTQITIKMIYVIAKPQTYYIWFDTTDSWRWGFHEGKCDGTHQGEDATTEFTTHANWNILNNTPPGIFYADFTHINYVGPMQVPLPEGMHNPYGYRDSYLFWNEGNTLPAPHECFYQSVMNYYLANLFVISDIYRPWGKFISHYRVYMDLGLGSDWEHLHRVDLTYGIAIAPNDPPIEL